MDRNIPDEPKQFFLLNRIVSEGVVYVKFEDVLAELGGIIAATARRHCTARTEECGWCAPLTQGMFCENCWARHWMKMNGVTEAQLNDAHNKLMFKIMDMYKDPKDQTTTSGK